jgi:Zn-finger nucleic acid-binding protein
MSLEGAQTTPLRCPACGSRLVEVERAEVLIDACPECRGVWLDRGELDKILVRERRMQAGHDDDEDFVREVEGRRRVPERRERRPDDRYADRYDERYSDDRRRRKRRSFLEELLDFD